MAMLADVAGPLGPLRIRRTDKVCGLSRCSGGTGGGRFGVAERLDDVRRGEDSEPHQRETLDRIEMMLLHDERVIERWRRLVGDESHSRPTFSCHCLDSSERSGDLGRRSGDDDLLEITELSGSRTRGTHVIESTANRHGHGLILA